MIKFNTKNSGFSLVETLVAITILLIVIVGPMTIASKATQGTNFSSEQVIASFLAQEGSELAQKARDDILLPLFETPGVADEAWDEFTDNGGQFADCFTGGCGLLIEDDADGSLDVSDCNSIADRNNCRLHYNMAGDARSHYGESGPDAEETIYTRIITMQETAGREVEVRSEVFWRTGDQRQEQSVEVVTYLFNVYGL